MERGSVVGDWVREVGCGEGAHIRTQDVLSLSLSKMETFQICLAEEGCD